MASNLKDFYVSISEGSPLEILLAIIVVHSLLSIEGELWGYKQKRLLKLSSIGTK